MMRVLTEITCVWTMYLTRYNAGKNHLYLRAQPYTELVRQLIIDIFDSDNDCGLSHK